jgi:hypothetical protein
MRAQSKVTLNKQIQFQFSSSAQTEQYLVQPTYVNSEIVTLMVFALEQKQHPFACAIWVSYQLSEATKNFRLHWY